MRKIDADELISRVRQSKNNNTHSDPRVRNNHYQEHEHFIQMIKWMPTIEANKEDHTENSSGGWGKHIENRFMNVN